MSEFFLIVRRQKIRCFFVVNTLCICYRNRNYMIEPDEDGWRSKVGKLDHALLQEIGKAIEEYIQNYKK